MGVCRNRFIGCILLFIWCGSAPAAPFAYITNFANANVSVIDIATNLVIATIQVDMLPQGVAINPAGTFVYVANRGADVSVIDVARNAVTATVQLGVGNLNGVAFSPTGSIAYITAQNDGVVGALCSVNTASNTLISCMPLPFSPYGVAVNPAGTRIYVANLNKLLVIDTANSTIIASVSAGFAPYGVATSPDGSRVYVTDNGAASVFVINAASNSIIATVPVGVAPTGIALNPTGTLAYVSNFASNSVSVIDTATNAVIATIPVGPAPWGISVDPLGTRVYVANFQSHTVSVINAATNSVIATVTVGAQPAAFGKFIGGAAPSPAAPVVVGPTLDAYALVALVGLLALTALGREVLLLVAVERLAYAEVATVLRVPVGTVLARLDHARQAMRLMTL